MNEKQAEGLYNFVVCNEAKQLFDEGKEDEAIELVVELIRKESKECMEEVKRIETEYTVECEVKSSDIVTNIPDNWMADAMEKLIEEANNCFNRISEHYASALNSNVQDVKDFLSIYYEWSIELQDGNYCLVGTPKPAEEIKEMFK